LGERSFKIILIDLNQKVTYFYGNIVIETKTSASLRAKRGVIASENVASLRAKRGNLLALREDCRASLAMTQRFRSQ
jgi:hypothetical protein